MMAAFPPHPGPVVNRREILSYPRVDRDERAERRGEEEMKLNEFTPLANDKKLGVRVGHVQIFVMRVVVDRMRESGSS